LNKQATGGAGVGARHAQISSMTGKHRRQVPSVNVFQSATPQPDVNLLRFLGATRSPYRPEGEFWVETPLPSAFADDLHCAIPDFNAQNRDFWKLFLKTVDIESNDNCNGGEA
jgi:hypothetical protein